jgi:hypothetical protein
MSKIQCNRIKFSLSEKEYGNLMDVLKFREEQDSGVIKNKVQRLVMLILKQRSRKNFA